MSAELTTCNELADYEWLTGDEAGAIANDLTRCNQPLHTLVASLRSRLSAQRTRLLLKLIELRRRAADKFSAADRMFFTRTSLEQATDEWVARYKAARFAARQAGSSPIATRSATPTAAPSSSRPYADLCCGIGGDLLALAEQGSITGIDLNPCIAHLAAANARTVLPREIQQRVTARAIDVEEFDLANFAAWHIDPDRRPQKQDRTSSPEWSTPGLAVIDRMLKQQPNAAIKLAPAADVPRQWIEHCELEWISRDRQCRQLVVWHGDLAQAVGRHRATVLASGGGGAGASRQQRSAPDSTRTITGSPNSPISLATHLDRYIFDIDPAVVAARLTGALASEHGLAALNAGPTYLTGSSALHDPALSCFEVNDVLPFHAKQLARYFRERNIGCLEIKKRGNDIDVDPEQLRRSLKLRGDNSATLLITRIAGRHTAIIAQRMEHAV